MDTRDTRVQNLLFLLSAAPLGVGCIITGGDDTDTEAVDPTTTDAPSTTTETPSTETSVGEETTAGSTDDRGETSTTEPPADTTMTPEDTTAGVEVPEICVPYGDAIEACFKGYGEEAVYDCTMFYGIYTENYGADCVAAFEDFIACLTALSCDDLMADPETVCVPEQEARDMACAKA